MVLRWTGGTCCLMFSVALKSAHQNQALSQLQGGQTDARISRQDVSPEKSLTFYCEITESIWEILSVVTCSAGWRPDTGICIQVIVEEKDGTQSG
jgi:hypothetical protein